MIFLDDKVARAIAGYGVGSLQFQIELYIRAVCQFWMCLNA